MKYKLSLFTQTYYEQDCINGENYDEEGTEK